MKKMKNNIKKIAVMGGSFDPCHNGHINLALDAKKQLVLEEVVLVPTKIQPFKINRKVAPDSDRLNMLRLAIEKFQGLRACDIEIMQDDISYTYKTLKNIKSFLGDGYKVYFLTGTDAFLEIEKWNNAEKLLKENSFLVGTRIGYKEEELEKIIDRVNENFNCEVIKIDNRKFEISSTEIRNKISSGQPIGDLVNKKVERYILEHELYK